MPTRQKYSGKGDSATSSASAAQNQHVGTTSDQTPAFNQQQETNQPLLQKSERKKANLATRPRKYSRQSLAKRDIPLSTRFCLIPPTKDQPYSNPHPLMLIVRVRTPEGIRAATSNLGNTLTVDPANWSSEKQLSAPGDPINKKLAAIRKKVRTIYQKQVEAGLIPSAKSITLELDTGESPQLINGKWGYSPAVYDTKTAFKLISKLSKKSTLKVAYQAYIAYLYMQRGTEKGLSDISLGRWKRGLTLLNAFASHTQMVLPKVNKIKVSWAKRFHIWLQTQSGGPRCPKPLSVVQASRFVLKVSTVLDWMIEDDLLKNNRIRRVRWPKLPDKEVQFLEPEHVYQLLNQDFRGTKGVAYWWFCLMCCTGLDYPDAVAYAQNRKAFEVLGPAGWKLVGKRNKPPHSDYHLPLLDEVNTLFSMIPNGPIIITNTCINRYTHEIEEELGISWRITNKTARKTFGCLMLAAGHRIADVSLMLGHRNIVTTEKYYVKVRGASIDRSMERVKTTIAQLAGKQDVNHPAPTSSNSPVSKRYTNPSPYQSFRRVE